MTRQLSRNDADIGAPWLRFCSTHPAQVNYLHWEMALCSASAGLLSWLPLPSMRMQAMSFKGCTHEEGWARVDSACHGGQGAKHVTSPHHKILSKFDWAAGSECCIGVLSVVLIWSPASIEFQAQDRSADPCLVQLWTLQRASPNQTSSCR